MSLCRFCQSNGEDESWYRGHVTRSPAGKVLCPVLRVYTCPVCAVIGDNAHTSSTAPRTGGEVFTRAEIHRKYASGKGKLVLVYS